MTPNTNRVEFVIIFFACIILSISCEQSKVMPLVAGRPESCLLCHSEMQGFGVGHLPALIGCSACHHGQTIMRDKDEAHKNMLPVPGNLADAKKSCGDRICHPDFAQWVPKSLMGTGRGLVSVNRFVFEESTSPDGPGHLSHLGDSPADKHLRQFCASCHLAIPKKEPAPISEKSRGGGCNACHLNYSDEAKQQLTLYKKTEELPKIHPQLNVQISNRHCFGCHSRSARISTSYEGWHETLLDSSQVEKSEAYRILQDGRVFSKQPQDIHHEKGLGCVDCHTWRETMGDGTSYNHQEEQIEISCEDCHFTEQPRTVELKNLDQHDLKVLGKRRWPVRPTTFLKIRKTGSPIINSLIDSTRSAKLILKNTGEIKNLAPPKPECGNNFPGHERLSCQSCHTQWAPTCIACHTEYEPEGTSYDHVAQKEVAGAWVEYADEQSAVLPTLGVSGSTIDTFIPGMILTIATPQNNLSISDKKGAIFRRMYAPISAHTIGTKSRTCESCHSDSRAIGYGAGALIFKKLEMNVGYWEFEPLYEPHLQDGLPADAWIAFLKDSPTSEATRINIRPFTIAEQKKILAVGVCLNCHKNTELNMNRIYAKLSNRRLKLSPSCYKMAN
ncbi:MAG: hypothetical protein DWQ05_22880 [Calditrichaeota bacterium]|nr:MAG: hypothetical protein DWQ05_22880 [Calditrichota bacterium]